MPAGYTLVRTIQMTDFFGPEQSRVFYGFVAGGGGLTVGRVARYSAQQRTIMVA